jgi:hypothetical protein
MLKKELKAALAILGFALIPLSAQADQALPVDQKSGVSDFLPGDKIKAGQLPGGYNQSASYDCQDPWHLILSADYIYWKWQQALLQVGTLLTPTAAGASGFLNGKAEVVFQNPTYASGFQLGLGCALKGMDNWNIYADYTWYQNTNDLTTISGIDQYMAVSPILLQYLDGATPGVLLAGDLYTTARMHFDGVDLLLERPFYMGRKLTANFLAGFEALWITQKFTATGSDLRFVSTNSNAPTAVNGTFNSYSQQKSWSIGPKFGLESNWLLGYGIKIVGSVAGSALYTSYIELQTATQGSVSNINIATLFFNQKKNYNTINPVAETSLGLGWGSYLYKNNLHFDILASYDFNVYWNQNLIDVLVNATGSPGNMLLHGLNIKARFDF